MLLTQLKTLAFLDGRFIEFGITAGRDCGGRGVAAPELVLGKADGTIICFIMRLPFIMLLFQIRNPLKTCDFRVFESIENV